MTNEMAGEPLGVKQTDWMEDYSFWLELFIAFNFICLTGDIVLAHASNRFHNPAEYIPVWFSLAAALVLMVGLLLRWRFARQSAWKNWGYIVAWSSLVVGAMGVVYHLDSHFFYERTLKSLTYTAPFAAPLSYMGLGCLLLMNRMIPRESREWPQWIFFFTLGGFVGNFVLSLADHATNGFFHWTEWIPVASTALAVGVLSAMLISKITPNFRDLCTTILLLQAVVGVLGFCFHFNADLHGPASRLMDNILGGAPPFAPLLLPNLSILGWIGLRTFRLQNAS